MQTSAHDVRLAARRIEAARVQKFALRRQESMNESQIIKQEPFLDEHDNQVSVLIFVLLMVTHRGAGNHSIFVWFGFGDEDCKGHLFLPDSAIWYRQDN